MESVNSKMMGSIRLSEMIPSNVVKSLMPGARYFGAFGTFGEILFQEISGIDYSIRFDRIFLKEEDEITFPNIKDHFLFQLSLENTIQDFKDGVPYNLFERGFNLFRPHETSTIIFHQGLQYQMFSIYFSKSFLSDITSKSSVIRELVSTGHEKSLTVTRSAIADEFMLAAIKRIANPPVAKSIFRIYRDTKLSEILSIALYKLQLTIPPYDIQLTFEESQKIYEAKKIIAKEMKIVSVEILSQRLGIDKNKLQIGFRKIFGLHLFEFLLETRMIKAEQLIETSGMNISEIASCLGLPDNESFAHYFKKYFGFEYSTVNGTDFKPPRDLQIEDFLN